MLILVILAGAVTGIVPGLFGSGGSILAMPALMYLLHVEPKSAIAMSLGIVAVTATISAWDNWPRGWKLFRNVFSKGCRKHISRNIYSAQTAYLPGLYYTPSYLFDLLKPGVEGNEKCCLMLKNATC